MKDGGQFILYRGQRIHRWRTDCFRQGQGGASKRIDYQEILDQKNVDIFSCYQNLINEKIYIRFGDQVGVYTIPWEDVPVHDPIDITQLGEP